MQQSVLVIEDNADVRQLTVEVLVEEGGYTVSAAGCITQAQALMAKSGGFDLLVLDVRLPDGDGRDFCAGLRRLGCQLPIVLLSGLADERDIARGLGAGADDYLVKPFSAAELLVRVRTQLRRVDYRNNLGVPSHIFAA